ncbi:MAG: TorD/DmsD family molecular chaperone [Planctomycetota bacterium]|jgi:TorA maturation chaperone TorD
MQEILNKVCQRADLYKFLSECYYLPDEELRQKVTDFAQTNQFFGELEDYIPPAIDLESLKIDFTRLFVGPFKVLAPPYGSVYLEDSRIMGESTIDVRNLYEKVGLDVVINDAPDHIAMELEFMYYLVVKQTQATNEGNLRDIQLYQQKQKKFLCSHLARWLPQFAKNVQENAQTTFYKKLTHLTEMFVQKDVKACTLFDIQQVYPTIKGL